MRRVAFGLVACVLVLAVMGVRAAEEKVPLDKVPKAVLTAVKAKFSGAKLTGASTEKEDGKVVYEIALTYKKHKYDVTVTPDGKITAIEKEITVKQLPKPVASALAKKYRGATIEKVEEVTKGETVTYEVHLVAGKKKRKLELVFDPSGKLLKKEEEKEEKDKKKD
jgi:uncharacterized membrane protein YkoI